MSKKTVLLADSHQLVLQGLAVMLQDRFELTAIGQVTDGLACIERIKKTPPGLLILDLPLSGLDGMSIIQQVKLIAPQTRILVLTAAELVTTWLEAYDLGADGVITKFAQADEMYKAVAKVLDGKRFFLNSEIDPYAVGHVVSDVDSIMNRQTRRLNPEERKIVRLLAAGYASADMAEVLGLSPGMIAMYKHMIKSKLNLATTPQIVKYAKETGITKLPLQLV